MANNEAINQDTAPGEGWDMTPESDQAQKAEEAEDIDMDEIGDVPPADAVPIEEKPKKIRIVTKDGLVDYITPYEKDEAGNVNDSYQDLVS